MPQVTAPITVLGSGAIRFLPALPRRKQVNLTLAARCQRSPGPPRCTPPPDIAHHPVVAAQMAMQRVQMCNAIKVMCVFDQPFWPEDFFDIICTGAHA